MAELTEERGAIYHIASPVSRKRMSIRPSIIWQLQGFDQSGSLQETLNFHSVSPWASLISHESRKLRKTGSGYPNVILTRDCMAREGEGASAAVQEELSGVVAAGSYSHLSASCCRVFGRVWTCHMDCRISKRGEELFEMLVNDRIMMHLEVAGKVCHPVEAAITFTPSNGQKLTLARTTTSEVWLAGDSHWRQLNRETAGEGRESMSQGPEMERNIVEWKHLATLTGIWARYAIG